MRVNLNLVLASTQCFIALVAWVLIIMHQWSITIPGSASAGWWVLKSNDPITEGAWVQGCLPINKSGDCTTSIKRVWHIGDEVVVDDDAIAVADKRLAAHPKSPVGILELSSNDKPIDADVWLYSSHPESLDSRYYGAVSRSHLQRAYPLATHYPKGFDQHE